MGPNKLESNLSSVKTQMGFQISWRLTCKVVNGTWLEENAVETLISNKLSTACCQSKKKMEQK